MSHQCELLITSYYSGENTTVAGTVVLDGVDYTVNCVGSASDRGTHTIINDEKFWWCGSEANESNPKLEEKIEAIFEDCFNQVEAQGDVDGNWTAQYSNGTVTSVSWEEDEDE